MAKPEGYEPRTVVVPKINPPVVKITFRLLAEVWTEEIPKGLDPDRYDLAVGWCLGKGLGLDDARDFALYLTEINKL